VSDVNEVERLRARVAELESQLAPADRAAAAEAPRRQSVWWSVGAAVLITVACILAPFAVTSVWADRVLSDTDQYVETVAPLADDPAVQAALAGEVTDTVLQYVDVEGVTTELLDTLAAQDNVPPRLAAALPGLAAPITNGVENFTRTQVNDFMASPQFATLWTQVNRIAHEQVVKLLEGNQGGAVSAQEDTITVNLGPIVAQVKERLVARGFGLANNIPTVDKSFVLVQSDAITSAQGFYQLLNTLGLWLPVVVLVLLVGGVALARDRRGALLRAGLGLAASMLLLGVLLAVARTWYAETTPADILSAQAAGDVFDTFVRFLRTSLRTVAVLGLVVAIGAFLTGPTSAAVRTRQSLEHGIGSLRGGAEAAGWETGRVGTWTFAHKRALRIGILVTGGLVLAFWSRPTAWVVVVLALVVVLLLAVVEFLGRPPLQPAAPPRAEGAESAEVPQQAAPPSAEARSGETTRETHDIPR
jgi:hypothetical protein